MTHDLQVLSQHLGKYFTGYLEFSDEQSEQVSVQSFCQNCNKAQQIRVPSKDVKENFRAQMINLTKELKNPVFKHFWFHARCSVCNKDIVLMRS